MSLLRTKLFFQKVAVAPVHFAETHDVSLAESLRAGLGDD